MKALAPVLARLESHADDALERLKELLRIPSISTDPEWAGETRRAAAWCAAQLSEIGFDAKVHDTPGHPMVVGRLDGPRGAPCILYYGHYDVQPPDPRDQWKSDPFEPAIVKGKDGPMIVARGAADDKGQVMTFIEAFRAWRDVHGGMPVSVVVMLEGEEESGSKSLDPFLEAHRSELAADVCVVSDSGLWNIDTPAITYMLRGLVYLDVVLRGPSHDLHSGQYGGAVLNPINALARLIAELHDDSRRVRIPGFYDDVLEPAPEELAAWRTLGFDEREFLASVGLTTPFGEAGRTALERIWSRPTCDCNGINAGYTGAGAKTVIPSHASVKVSCRLVPEQDPETIRAALIAYLESKKPADARLEFRTHGLNPAIRVPTDSVWLEAASKGLHETFGRDPVLIGSGGSIPVVGSIARILGFDSLLVGFGLDDDRVHSPNEKFDLRCFHQGMRSHAAMIEAFARVPAAKAGR